MTKDQIAAEIKATEERLTALRRYLAAPNTYRWGYLDTVRGGIILGSHADCSHVRVEGSNIHLAKEYDDKTTRSYLPADSLNATLQNIWFLVPCDHEGNPLIAAVKPKKTKRS
jgi:hypothetical protein